jgi:hypothetical protein
MPREKPKAKALTQKRWAEMKTRYQMGDGVREIARDFDYDSGNLTRRLKKEGIKQGELKDIIDKKVVDAAKSIKTITPEICDVTTPAQRPSIQKALDERAAEWLGIVENTTDMALRFNQKILRDTIAQTEPGNQKYRLHEAAAILRTLGVSQDKLLEQTGISATPTQPPEKHAEKYDNAVDSVRAYQKMLNETN